MEKVYLSLGSNLGDRNSNLLAAVNELDRMMGAPHSALSSFIETRSWGFSGHDFINCAVMYETELPPEEILGMLYGRRTVDTPELKIPHPLMREREFVMRPLMEIYR